MLLCCCVDVDLSARISRPTATATGATIFVKVGTKVPSDQREYFESKRDNLAHSDIVNGLLRTARVKMFLKFCWCCFPTIHNSKVGHFRFSHCCIIRFHFRFLCVVFPVLSFLNHYPNYSLIVMVVNNQIAYLPIMRLAAKYISRLSLARYLRKI